MAQYDISDRAAPRFVSRIWLGGVVREGGGLTVTGGLPDDTPSAPRIPTVRGKELPGGPQMLQLRWADQAAGRRQGALGRGARFD